MFTVTVPAGRSHLPDDRIGAPRARMSTSVGAEPFVAEAMRWLPGDTGQLEADSGPGAVDEATIVLADDNADMREYLTRLLGGRWRVVAAADGNAALEAVRARRPDLVLTDVMMPGLDGFALLEAIREDPRTSSIPVILLSGRAGEEARVEGLQAGADDYLVKPFGARELIARVGAHLALSRVRRDAAAAMRESEDRLRMAVESAGLGTWDFRPSTGKLTWDDRCKAMFGLPPDADVDYDTFVAGLHPDDRERVHEVGRRALTPESGGRVDDEYRTVGIADGVERWVAVKGQAYFDAEGRAVRYVGTVRDITAEKRAEKERETLLALEREARRQAEEASRLKDEFLATVSHELRTPLNAILGWSLLLYERRVEGEATSRALETIDRNARALAQLVEDLLDVSRIISGKLRLDVEIIEPAPCIEAAIETLEPAAAAKGISVATALDHHAGPVSGDPARLQQIVWNLLSNAIKFTPRGGHVEVKLSRVASHVEITVEDSGQGISPEFLPHVFDRFRQADGATTRSHGGLGLGLAIARHLVEAHGGSIEAASEGKGRGAAFTLSLPLAAVRPDSRPFAAVEPDEERRLDGVRVLVVDDDADARALVAVVVKQRGAEVASAGSAAEALALVETFRPDVLVSDIGMPGRDGYDLIRAVRALPPERGGRTPAVALTAYARVEDRVRAIRAGYQLHVPKPVEPEELAVVVASLATNDLR